MTPATLIIEFGQGVDQNALVKAELDDTLNVDANGEVITQFAPDDVIHFVVHHDPELVIASVKPTSGQVTAQGEVVRTRTNEAVLFTDGNKTHDLGYLINGAPSETWYGNVAALSRSGLILTAGDTSILPALADISMAVTFKSYVHNPPPLDLAIDETWPVRIVIKMENAS